ncbi:DUF1800 domain-containing protein [Dyadobacter psychrotolerans]|uniref:DUF1800 domain-containing protein n=1 Tax=Dyadobacter psychrotolerans TaxID=2541721 RepID=A0A4R5DFJ8_9BACT|nr:DUF1800 domain-containing protein [Dyadobacter psychrotolerans]TDE10544.1 DUF1800 domain-containing protein [Dyadobacter psychrotolerans]
MKAISCYVLIILGGWMFLSSFQNPDPAKISASNFPYKKAGLTERQAAAHLLSRFTYGATPAEIDEVVKQGLENWFQKQLIAGLPDDTLESLLANYDALKLSNSEVLAIYPKAGQTLRMAVKDGAIDKDSVKTNKVQYRQALDIYMQQKGLKPQRELTRQFISQKILRAAYTENQLQEVMTSFWFNHFNVSLTKNDCSPFIPAYERDVIRPNALGNFSVMLLATAKSPAMLYYLDNFSSSANDKNTNLRSRKKAANPDNQGKMDSLMTKLQKAKKEKGLNENYAREVMELHTLGVDGGYTQQDVTQAARVLTGWTVFPSSAYNRTKGLNQNEDRLEKRGFIHEGDFLFAANRHDTGKKMVLGKSYGTTENGYQEGVTLLHELANHQGTAKFISKKIAVRFVSDNPSQMLIDRMAKTFLDQNGDIKSVLITMVNSPEFWSAASLREKTKSPFELVIGSVRSLKAEITQPYQLYNWITRMGEKMYAYQAPTGFPDRGQYWINTGALLNRMNFGLALASGRIPGIKVNLAALNNNHEPESSQAALITYSKLIIPERNTEQTIERLSPMLNDPKLTEKVDKASNATSPIEKDQMNVVQMDPKPDIKTRRNKQEAMQNSVGSNAMLAQVVGVIIGSPEYQRR